MIKKYMPWGLKQFLWFVFKSPQRKWIGWSSLLTDFSGYLHVWFKPKTYERLTVCVGVKNRSETLLSNLIDSMNKARMKGMLNLSVYDCGSSDCENLFEEICKRWEGKINYRKVEQDFARSKAFNEAVKQSETNLILVCDADMSLPEDIVRKVSKYCSKRSAWFPVVWYTNKDGSGRFYTESTGMMAAYKSDFLKTGAYDESIKTWGKEDWLLFFEFYKIKMACIRSRERNFIHHYHESLKPEGFVPLF